MALRKNDLAKAAAADTRDLVREAPELMRPYQFKMQPALLEQFRAHCARRGLSMSAGVRMAVLEFMAKEGLR